MNEQATTDTEVCDRYHKVMAAADHYASMGDWGKVARIIRKLVEERPIELKLIEIKERNRNHVKEQ
jgi:hypothetical protein